MIATVFFFSFFFFPDHELSQRLYTLFVLTDGAQRGIHSLSVLFFGGCSPMLLSLFLGSASIDVSSDVFSRLY